MLRPDAIEAAPPDPLVPLPTDITMAPARPPVAAPVPTVRLPTVPRYRRPRTKRERPARARRSAIRRADDNSAAARRGALPGRERDAPAGPRRAAASSKIRSAARSARPAARADAHRPTATARRRSEPIEIPPPFPLLAEPELNASSPPRRTHRRWHSRRPPRPSSSPSLRQRRPQRDLPSPPRFCRTQTTTPHRRCSSRCRPRRSRRRPGSSPARTLS